MQRSAFHILISVTDQELSLFKEKQLLSHYPVSTAKLGVGFAEGSYQTPTGNFFIKEIIGEDQPIGTAFEGRKPIWPWNSPLLKKLSWLTTVFLRMASVFATHSNDDHILSRILRLEGTDKENANTFDRYIYIHGTNHEHEIGTPTSHGCIRMRNRDIVRLTEEIDLETTVEITS